jgi:hypothetical protein
MGKLSIVGAALTRLERAFLQDNFQAFRIALREIQDAIAPLGVESPTEVRDSYEQVEAFEKGWPK